MGLFLWIFGFRQAARWFIGIGGGGLILAGFTPLGYWLIGPLENRYPLPDSPEPVDGIVVLGGSELATLSELYGFPQVNSLGERYLTTLLLAAKFPRAQVVHTGYGARGDGEEGTLGGETKVAAAILEGAGVAPERLIFEDRSRNTCENAAHSKARVNPREGERWLLVTSAFHMPRAMACFRANNWEIIPHPADFKRAPMLSVDLSLFTFANNLAALDLALHEWLGLLYYRLLGRIDEI